MAEATWMRPAAPRVWRLLDFVLLLMLTGPILAPLFDATGIWLFERIAGWIIYPLGLWVCPQEAHLLHWGPHAMAVCSRCYAAIGGLGVVRHALTSDPAGRGVGPWLARAWRRVPAPGRASFIVGVVALWQLDIWAERLGWWSWGHAMLIATGPLVGLALGFLAYGLLARLTGLPATWDAPQP